MGPPGREAAFVLVATLGLCVAGSGPRFAPGDRNVSVPVGRDAVLNCTVHNASTHKVAWIYTGVGTVLTVGEELVTSNPRVGVRHLESAAGADSWLLLLQQVTARDAGTYMCQVTKPGLRLLYNLSVVVPPNILDSGSSRDVEVEEGETARLSCAASGSPPPRIFWRREDAKLIRQAGHRESVYEGETLVVGGAQMGDAGAYLCIAKNGVPPSVSKRVQLLVRYGPKVAAEEAVVEAGLGRDARMACVVEGWPTPSVQWLRTNAGNSLSHRHVREEPRMVASSQQISRTRAVAVLQVRGVRLDDLGEYLCRASSIMGEAQAHLLLTGEAASGEEVGGADVPGAHEEWEDPRNTFTYTSKGTSCSTSSVSLLLPLVLLLFLLPHQPLMSSPAVPPSPHRPTRIRERRGCGLRASPAPPPSPYQRESLQTM